MNSFKLQLFMGRGIIINTSIVTFIKLICIFHQYLPHQACERAGNNATGKNLLILNLRQLNTVLGPFESIINDNWLLSARIMTIFSTDQEEKKLRH